MKEYIKPELEYIDFNMEPITSGTADGSGDLVSNPDAVDPRG